MKAGWELKALQDVCTIANGGTPKSGVASYWGGDVNWLTPKDMGQMMGRHISSTPRKISEQGLSNCSAKLVPPSSVIMSTRAPIGHLAINDVPMAFNQGCRGLVPSGALDPLYLYYFLSSSTDALNDLGTGATFKELSSGALKEFCIPLPSVEEQKRIVVILDEAFEGLARARANAAANLQNARELFEAVREDALDPARATRLSAVRLKDLVDIKHGFAFKSEFFVEDGTHVVLTPGNYFETGGYKDRGAKQKYYSGEVPRDYVLRKGDLLMAMTEQAPGLLGSSIIVPDDDRFLHNQRLGLILPKEGVAWSADFFFHIFNLTKFRQALSDTCTGATVRHTSPSRIQDVVVPYVDDTAEQRRIAGYLYEREDEYHRLEVNYGRDADDIEALRQSILQKAFAGELT